MDVRLEIIDVAIKLINLFAHENDEEFVEIVGEAICKCDIGMLLDLEETLEE